MEAITINVYEVKARTRKVNRLLSTIKALPEGLQGDVKSLIVGGDATPAVWDSLARMSGTIVAGEGTKRTLAILLTVERERAKVAA